MRYTRSIHACCLCLAFVTSSQQAFADPAESDPSELDRIIVTETRLPSTYLDVAGNTATIGRNEIQATGQKHISELMYRAPGTWIVRGSGQEHLTAIRSPVLTGAGACGAILFLEGGIPIRPSGFCNVNQLFEINTEQAGTIEVVRGPGSTMYGSNALHGLINVLMPKPADPGINTISVEAGSDDYYRAKFDLGNWDGRSGLRLLANYTDDGGFRDNSGFEQAKVNLVYSGVSESGSFDVSFAATNLDQDTAGFIFGQDAYRDDALRKGNVNPEAFRDAESQRLSFRWFRELDNGTLLDVRPHWRRSRMEFLQHFLPGQPLEENGQNSAGILFTAEKSLSEQSVLTGGIDVELTDGFLLEDQAEPITGGSAFLMETRPEGKHYDFEVKALSLAPYVNIIHDISERLILSAGLRAEYLRYEYENLMLDGNTREDGTECGFGGCLFNRPPDGTDSFSNLAPKIGVVYSVTPYSRMYVSLRRGFRAPQATELYRLQRQQMVSDLDSEELDSVELGWRGLFGGIWLDLSAFYMKKRNFLFRDSDGINVSDGKTTHSGIEIDFFYNITDTLTIKLAGSYAMHEYDFDRDIGGGDAIVSGNAVDTAPETLGSGHLDWHYSPKGVAELELIHVSEHYLDAANTARYEGHDLLNIRVNQELSDHWRAIFRIHNLTDEKYAERADFAFGNYRYFPGRERSYFLEILYSTP